VRELMKKYSDFDMVKASIGLQLQEVHGRDNKEVSQFKT
jgi:hypothetical protein